jgi:hypothetical protein
MLLDDMSQAPPPRPSNAATAIPAMPSAVGRGGDICRPGPAWLGVQNRARPICGPQFAQGVFSRHALIACPRGRLFGVCSCGAGLRRRHFQLGSAAHFPGGFLFRCQARERRGFGNLFCASGFGRQLGGVLFGGKAFLCQLRQILFGSGARLTELGQFHGGKFTSLGIDLRLLFGVNSPTQRDLGAAFGIRLLDQRRLGERIGLGALQRLGGGEFFSLLSPGRRRRTFRGNELASPGMGAGLIVGAGAGQRFGFGHPIGHQDIAVGKRDASSVSLHAAGPHQIEQCPAHEIDSVSIPPA